MSRSESRRVIRKPPRNRTFTGDRRMGGELAPQCSGLVYIPDRELFGYGSEVLVTAETIQNHFAGDRLDNVSNASYAKFLLQIVALECRTRQNAKRIAIRRQGLQHFHPGKFGKVEIQED